MRHSEKKIEQKQPNQMIYGIILVISDDWSSERRKYLRHNIEKKCKNLENIKNIFRIDKHLQIW